MTGRRIALPRRALIDTSALICALRERPTDPSNEAASDFVARMLKDNRQVLIAAPTLAEVLDKGRPNAAPPPLVRDLLVVPFDDLAAVELAAKLPKEHLKVHRADAGQPTPLAYYRYDAMIIACALRHRADCFVSCDDRQLARARAAGLAAHHPRDYQAGQQVEMKIASVSTLGATPEAE